MKSAVLLELPAQGGADRQGLTDYRQKLLLICLVSLSCEQKVSSVINSHRTSSATIQEDSQVRKHKKAVPRMQFNMLTN